MVPALASVARYPIYVVAVEEVGAQYQVYGSDVPEGQSNRLQVRGRDTPCVVE